jgi:hypothetical protein
MDSFNIRIFIVPSIALILVLLFYFYFYKKVENKQNFKSFFWRIAFLAFLFNLGWEITQGFLYQGYVYDFQHISFCALASVADVFMIFLLYFGFSLIYRNFYWIQRLTFLKASLLVIAGGVGAIFAETKHLAAGNWVYADAMPLLPIVDVGLSPVLQFMVLPVLIYWLSFRRVRKTDNFVK